MRNRQVVLIIIISVVFGFLVNLLFQRLVLAMISTIPVVNRWKLLNPQAPIVINTREEVRVSDSGDVLDAISSARAKLCAITLQDTTRVNVVQGCVNLTSDGVFVTAGNVFNTSIDNFKVVLDDGRTAKIISNIFDPQTGLTFFKADLNGVPTAALGNSKNLNSGEKILFLAHSISGHNVNFLLSFVSRAQTDFAGQILDSDRPTWSFNVQNIPQQTPGLTAVNLKGEVVGLWTGSNVISSDILRQISNIYFSNAGHLPHPSFGFSYKTITATESKILNLPEGVQVVDVSKASPAQTAGLQNGDIITSVNNDQVNESGPLIEILFKYKPDDQVKFKVTRGKNNLELTLKVGLLK